MQTLALVKEIASCVFYLAAGLGGTYTIISTITVFLPPGKLRHYLEGACLDLAKLKRSPATDEHNIPES